MIEEPQRDWKKDDLPAITSEWLTWSVCSDVLYIVCRWFHCISSVMGCNNTEQGIHVYVTRCICTSVALCAILLLLHTCTCVACQSSSESEEFERDSTSEPGKTPF